MINRHNFASVIKQYMSAFVEERESQGFVTAPIVANMRSFDKFLVETMCADPSISKEVYDRWIDSISHLSGHTIYLRACSVISLLEYMCEVGCTCYIPRHPKTIKSEYIPYIFSESEMARIFDAADNWRDSVHRCDSHAMPMPALLRLLYSTGMRIGEAVAINNRDINYDKHVIHIYKTKNRRERLAPINESLEKVLRQYAEYRNMMPIPDVDRPEKPFFITSKGFRCHPHSIRLRFKKILGVAGIPTAHDGHEVRVHDIRHTVCVHAMTSLARNGKDLYCALPSISTFMGHLSVLSTEYYLRLTSVMYPEMFKRELLVTGPIHDLIVNALKNIPNEEEQ